MRARRTAATALAVGAVLLASASTAAAQDRPDGSTVPGMVRMHEQMNGPGLGMAQTHELHVEQNPGMARMHQLHVEQNPGMARMPQRMTEGPR